MDDATRLREALTAVQDEVLKIMGAEDVPGWIDERLSLIESICRHGIDVRSDADRKRE